MSNTVPFADHLWALISTCRVAQYDGAIPDAPSEFLERVWPAFLKGLGQSLSKIGKDGLMLVTGKADYQRKDTGGEYLPANILLHEALRCGAEVAASLGHNGSIAKQWRAAASELRSAINGLLFD